MGDLSIWFMTALLCLFVGYLLGIATTPRTNSEDVGAFHEKFGLPNTLYRRVGPRTVEPELLEFRFRFLHEELEEFATGIREGNEAKAFDALIDLVYVAMGTAHLLGYPWQEGWDLVQRANMQKQRARRAEDSKRGSTWDVVKPPGWQPPAIGALLEAHGWPRENISAEPGRPSV